MSIEISRQTHEEYKEVFMYFSEEARTQGDKAKIGTDEFTTVRSAFAFGLLKLRRSIKRCLHRWYAPLDTHQLKLN